MMDFIEEDLRRADVLKLGKTTGRRRITLSNIAEDREHWRKLIATSTTESS